MSRGQTEILISGLIFGRNEIVLESYVYKVITANVAVSVAKEL
jgi:hypothetical protein